MTMTAADNVSNPESTGGAGHTFEARVQATHLLALLLGRNIPCLPDRSLFELRFQTRVEGCQTDDLLCRLRTPEGDVQRALIQIKRTVLPNPSNAAFSDSVVGAWNDFHNSSVITRGKDVLIMVYGVHSASKMQGCERVCDWARATPNASEWARRIDEDVFSNDENRRALRSLWAVLQNSLQGPIPPDDVFQFARHLHFSSYDLETEGTMGHSFLLNLISVACGPSFPESSQVVWAELVGACQRCNGHAAVLTTDTVETYVSPAVLAAFRRHLLAGGGLAPLHVLKGHSKQVLETIRLALPNGAELSRNSLVDETRAALSIASIVLVAGDAGSGKSAVARKALQSLEAVSEIVAFKAEDFNTSSFDSALTEIGFTGGGHNFQAQLALQNQVFILIDGAEKLAEFEQADAFSQFITLASKNTTWRVLITARSQSLEVLHTTLLPTLTRQVVEVSHLTEAEVIEVLEHEEGLRALVHESDVVRSVLRIPFYLGLALKHAHENIGIATAATGEVSLRQYLWRQAVECPAEVKSGMPSRRRQAFIDLCKRRAQGLSQYVEPPVDSEAVSRLFRDGILFEDPMHWVAPAHDVFDDWALRLHVQEQVRAAQRDWPALFRQLGTGPAIRRAVRAWLCDSLSLDDADAASIAEAVPVEERIAQFWRDDICIGILRSSAASRFLMQNKQRLLANDKTFLKRVVHLTRVACKGPSPTVLAAAGAAGAAARWNLRTVFVVPTTEAWAVLLAILAEVRALLSSADVKWVSGLLSDWSTSFDPYKATPPSAKDALDVALRLFEVERERANYVDARVTETLQLLVKFTGGDPARVEALFRGWLATSPEQASKRDLASYYRIAAATNTCVPLCVHLPELAIDLFRAAHLRRQEDPDEDMWSPSSTSAEEPFGFEDFHEYQYEPASAIQGVFWPLLRKHPKTAIPFIVGLANYAARCYRESAWGKEAIEIEAAFASSGSLISSQRLWGMYRGQEVGPDALQCALMALEQFLLQVAELPEGSEVAKLWLSNVLRQSESVATVAIVAGIYAAHPYLVTKETLALYSVPPFFQIDMQRATKEASFGALWEGFGFDSASDKIHREERKEASNRTHRKEYMEHTLLRLQLGPLAADVHRLLDGLSSALPPVEVQTKEDHAWRLCLRRMDLRGMQAKRLPEGVMFEVVTPLAPELEAYSKEGLGRSEPFLRLMRLRRWAEACIKGETLEDSAFGSAREALIEVKVLLAMDESVFELGRMRIEAAVAAALLRALKNELDKDECAWCMQQVVGALTAPRTSGRGYEDEVGRMPYEGTRLSAVAVCALVDDKEHGEVARRALAVAVTHRIGEVQDFAAMGVRDILFGANVSLATTCVDGFLRLAEAKQRAMGGPFEQREKRWATEIAKVRQDLETRLLAGTNEHKTRPRLSSGVEYSVMKRWAALLHSLSEEALEGRLETVRWLAKHAPKFSSYYLNSFVVAEDSTPKPTLFWKVWKAAADVCFGQEDLGAYGRHYSRRFTPLLQALLFVNTFKPQAHEWKTFEAEGGFLEETIERVGDVEEAFKCLVPLVATVGRTKYLPGALLWLEAARKRCTSFDPLANEVTVVYLEIALRVCLLDHGSGVRADAKLRSAVVALLDELVNAGSSAAFQLREYFITARA
jgi:hypothetical protein